MTFATATGKIRMVSTSPWTYEMHLRKPEYLANSSIQPTKEHLLAIASFPYWYTRKQEMHESEEMKETTLAMNLSINFCLGLSTMLYSCLASI
jgi:hypothetical protein